MWVITKQSSCSFIELEAAVVSLVVLFLYWLQRLRLLPTVESGSTVFLQRMDVCRTFGVVHVQGTDIVGVSPTVSAVSSLVQTVVHKQALWGVILNGLPPMKGQ